AERSFTYIQRRARCRSTRIQQPKLFQPVRPKAIDASGKALQPWLLDLYFEHSVARAHVANQSVCYEFHPNVAAFRWARAFDAGIDLKACRLDRIALRFRSVAEEFWLRNFYVDVFILNRHTQEASQRCNHPRVNLHVKKA